MPGETFEIRRVAKNKSREKSFNVVEKKGSVLEVQVPKNLQRTTRIRISIEKGKEILLNKFWIILKYGIIKFHSANTIKKTAESLETKNWYNGFVCCR